MKLIKDLGMVYANENSKQRIHYGLYECPECSRKYNMRIYDVNRRNTKMCRSCSAGIRKTKHGDFGKPLYTKWASMKQRCYDKNCKSYSDYGGRGITVCNEWHDYIMFKEWSISNGYKDGLEIDRLDNDSDYEPNNCRFVHRETNAQNKRLLMSSNKSGYRGVCYINRDKVFSASIRVNGKRHNLKRSKCKIECAKAYDKYVLDNDLEHPTNFKKESYE